MWGESEGVCYSTYSFLIFSQGRFSFDFRKISKLNYVWILLRDWAVYLLNRLELALTSDMKPSLFIKVGSTGQKSCN